MSFKMRYLDRMLGVAAALAIVLAFYASAYRAPSISEHTPAFLTWQPPYYSDALLNLSSGFAISVLFYFLIVRIPQSAQRKRLRRGLVGIYANVRVSIMRQILSASKLYDEDAEKLANDAKARRKLFDTFTDHANKEWKAVVNGLDDWHVQKIQLELQVLSDEIHYVMEKIDIEDIGLTAYLKNLSVVILEMNQLSADYDDQKTWGNFLWSLFTFFDWEKSYLSEDPVLTMFEKI